MDRFIYPFFENCTIALAYVGIFLYLCSVLNI